MRASSVSARRSSLRRSIFSSSSNGKAAAAGNDLIEPSPGKPIPRKLNDYFDAIASDSD